MPESMFPLLAVAIIYGILTTQTAGDSILALYDKASQDGGLQKAAYVLAAKEFNGSVIYQQCQDEESDSELMMSLIADGLLNVTDASSGRDRVVVVGSCSLQLPQDWLPQVICSSQPQTTTDNIVNLQRTILSVYPAVRDILYNINASSVWMRYSSKEEVNQLSGMLLSDGFSVTLSNNTYTAGLCSPQVAIALSEYEACLTSTNHVTILMSEGDDFTSPLCGGDNSNIYIVSWRRSQENLQVLRRANASQSSQLHSTLDAGTLNDLWCRYRSMQVVQSALSKTTSNSQLLNELKLEQKRILRGGNGEGEADSVVIIRQNNALMSVVGHWSYKMGLNLTDEIAPQNSSQVSIDVYNSQLTALGIISAFALVGVVYSAALIVFNCSKSKDRTIKLTSPNMNIIICFGSILVLLSLPLLGIERPIMLDLDMVGTLQQVGMFSMSVGLTIIYSSVLVKTWRVHRIFKKMHLSSKGTKDEHLMLMVTAFTLIDVAINATWAKIDQINCVYYLHLTPTQSTDITCSSEYQEVWICLLVCYKLLLTFITLFYAWHVRHVKLPSLQDSQFIFTNSLITIVVLLTSVPALVYAETISTIRYSTAGVSALAIVYSTLSLLLAPKIFLVRNKGGSKANSAVKFLFGESLKKQKERDEPPKGCWAGFKSCNSQSGSSMGDSILSQEIETLKQLVKEKDETIRELTDRLFFGADKFKAYVKDKTASYRRSCSSPAVSTITDSDHYQHHRTRSRQGRLHSKSQCSPVGSVDSGTVDDMYQTRSQSKSQPNYYTMENPPSSRHNAQSQLSHTLPPIKEMSANDLTNHCRPTDEQTSQCYPGPERSVTPTTDSAINMSHSASSSDDESYNDRRNVNSPRDFNSLGQVKRMGYQRQDTETSSVDRTLKSIAAMTASAERQLEFPDKSYDKHPQYVSQRLAAVTDRRQSTKVSDKQANHYAHYSKQHRHQRDHTTPISNGVEMEMVFPVSECL